MIEKWEDIEGYPNYQVSNNGNVKNSKKDKLLNPFFNKKPNKETGYLEVTLYYEGIGKKFKVHILVLEAFLCERPEGLLGCHKDDHIFNNNIENLYWGTYVENARDSNVNGLHLIGSKHPCASLTDEDVINIRKMRKAGAKYSEILSEYNIGKSTLSDVINKKTYKNIP